MTLCWVLFLLLAAAESESYRFLQDLRHRASRMSLFRYRDDDSSTGTTVAGVLLGAIAGFAVGMFVAQRVGGFSGIAARIKKRRHNGDEALAGSADAVDEFADESDVIEDEE